MLPFAKLWILSPSNGWKCIRNFANIMFLVEFRRINREENWRFSEKIASPPSPQPLPLCGPWFCTEIIELWTSESKETSGYSDSALPLSSSDAKFPTLPNHINLLIHWYHCQYQVVMSRAVIWTLSMNRAVTIQKHSKVSGNTQCEPTGQET